MPDEDLIRAKEMPVRAAGWWSGDPLAIRGLHQVAQHVPSPGFVAPGASPQLSTLAIPDRS
jgi:hypothetical protein